MMLHDISLLQSLEIPAPCPERWEAMQGDERQRRCLRCDCPVHDLAMLGREDAERLLRAAQQVDTPLCV
jgi:hypothetical protein